MVFARNLLCGSAKAQVIHAKKAEKTPECCASLHQIWLSFALETSARDTGSHQTGTPSSRGGWMQAWQPAGMENGSGIKALTDAPEGRSTSRSVWEHGSRVSHLPGSQMYFHMLVQHIFCIYLNPLIIFLEAICRLIRNALLPVGLQANSPFRRPPRCRKAQFKCCPSAIHQFSR